MAEPERPFRGSAGAPSPVQPEPETPPGSSGAQPNNMGPTTRHGVLAAPADEEANASLSLIPTAKVNHPKTEEAGKAWEDKRAKFERRKRAGMRVANYGMGREARDLYAEQEEALLWRAHRQQECGNYLVMRQAIEGDDVTPRLHRATLCGLRWTCPICAAQLGAKKASHYAARLAELRLADENRRAYFVTLTVANGPDLRESFDMLAAGVKKIHLRYQNAKARKNGSTFGRIVAQVGQFEVKRGEGSGLWHPHYHGILVTDGRFDYGEFRQAWADALGRENAWCKVLLCRTEYAIRNGAGLDLEAMRSGFMGDLSEVIKYVHKIDGRRPEDAWFCWATLGAQRMTRTWGQVRHKSFDELTDEPLDWDQVAFIERMLCWEGNEYAVHEMPGTVEPYDEFAAYGE